MSVILAGTTITSGLVLESDTTGNLVIKTGAGSGTTAMTINSSQVVSFVNPPTGVAGLPPVTVTASTAITAAAGNHYVLTAATAATITLPASPTISDTVWVTVANSLVTNVVARNGKNIQGIAEDMTLNDPYAAAQLRFSDNTEGWILI
jgi:hypothetical protein